MAVHLVPRGKPGRQPGDGRGVMRGGSMTSRLLELIEREGAVGYPDLARAFPSAKISLLSRALSYLVAAGRIRRVGRGRYARMKDEACLRPDGCLALVVHGRAIIVPPVVVAEIRGVLK